MGYSSQAGWNLLPAVADCLCFLLGVECIAVYHTVYHGVERGIYAAFGNLHPTLGRVGQWNVKLKCPFPVVVTASKTGEAAIARSSRSRIPGSRCAAYS